MAKKRIARLNGHAAGHYITQWSPDNRPVISVSDGDTIEVDVPDSSTDQVTRSMTVSGLKKIDTSKTDAAVGPIFVEEAFPGDILRVDLLDIKPANWGWSAVFPGFGLLSDFFPKHRLFHWSIQNGFARPRGDAFLSGLRIPIKPFLGVIGVSPAKAREGYGMIPPQHFGGNMDNNRICAGSTVYFRVNVRGGNLCIADTHAAQGDGEVCGTAVETPSRTRIRVRVYREMEFDMKTPTVVYTEGGRKSRRVSTSGISPDLMIGARDAVLSMISIMEAGGIERYEAYVMCSVAGSLRISEIVDSPNWNVGFSIDSALLKQIGVNF